MLVVHFTQHPWLQNPWTGVNFSSKFQFPYLASFWKRTWLETLNDVLSIFRYIRMSPDQFNHVSDLLRKRIIKKASHLSTYSLRRTSSCYIALSSYREYETVNRIWIQIGKIYGQFYYWWSMQRTLGCAGKLCAAPVCIKWMGENFWWLLWTLEYTAMYRGYWWETRCLYKPA